MDRLEAMKTFVRVVERTNWGPHEADCRALAQTTAGTRVVSYTITWTDKPTGKYWVQVIGYSGRV